MPLFLSNKPDEHDTALVETPMVIIVLLASLNSCVNPWIYLSFNDHVTVSWLCRRRASSRNHGSNGFTSGMTRACSRPGSGDTALRRVASRPPRSTAINDGKRSTCVDLWCYFCMTLLLRIVSVVVDTGTESVNSRNRRSHSQCL